MGKFKKGCAPLIALIQISAFLIYAPVSGEEAGTSSNPPEPAFMSSNYFVIYYSPSADLKKIEMELKKRPLYFDQAARYGEVTVSREICHRLDQLFNYVKETLNMYPKAGKIKIVIFRDRAELDAEHLKISGKSESSKSFYVYEHNTIYTSENDITDSVMAHEMAHAVTDHYFSIVPPEIVREILASYVDAHLEG